MDTDKLSIKTANKAYNLSDFEKALQLYEEIVIAKPFMAKILAVNIKNCKKHLGISTPLVSIIVPTHNTASFLERCLHSICSQTLNELEVIVINDGCTDSTEQILQEWAHKDSRIKIIHNHEASGSSGIPRNQAIHLTKGKYIGFVDSDDWVEPNMFEDLYLLAESNSADIATSGGYIKEEEGKQGKACSFPDEVKDNDQKLMEGLGIYASPYFTICWHRIYKREFVYENDIRFGTLKSSTDSVFTFQAVTLAKKIVFTKKIYYHYNFGRPGSTIEARKGESAFDMFSSYDEIYKRVFSKGNFEKNLLGGFVYKFLGDCSYNYKMLREDLRLEFNARKQEFLHKIKHENIDIPTNGYSEYWKKMLNESLNSDINTKDFKRKEYNCNMISVIIPAAGTARYLPMSIGSITSSLKVNTEIIVVIDGYEENLEMLDICQSLQCVSNPNCKIKVTTIYESTKLPGKPRNVGIEIANGKYIGFLDSDDWVDPGYYQTLIDAANDNGFPDIVANTLFSLVNANESKKNIQYVLSNSKLDEVQKKGDSSTKQALALSPQVSSVWNRIYRNSFIKEHGIRFPNTYFSEDYAFSISAIAKADTLGLVKSECSYNYRYNRKGSTTDTRSGIAALKILEQELILDQYLISRKVLPVMQNLHSFSRLKSISYTLSRLEDESLQKRFLELCRSCAKSHLNNINFEKLEISEGDKQYWLKSFQKLI